MITVSNLTYSYPATRKNKEPQIALNDVSFQVNKGEIFGLLGPNGSGKSTLFKILSTLLRSSQGTTKIFDVDVNQDALSVRKAIGVVFQHPSLDAKLTARENLLHQGHLYGLSGDSLKNRIAASLSTVGLTDRANDVVEHLSGGLQRRVELAKALLHQPKLLILDEPSTGLDPGARIDFMNYLKTLRDNNGVMIVLTTHILDEAEHCDRIAILDKGKLVALGTPPELKKKIGGDVITVTTSDPVKLSEAIQTKFRIKPNNVNGTLYIERNNGHEFIPQLVQSFPGLIDSVMLAKPSLEDVFIHHTGHKFWENGTKV